LHAPQLRARNEPCPSFSQRGARVREIVLVSPRAAVAAIHQWPCSSSRWGVLVRWSSATTIPATARSWNERVGRFFSRNVARDRGGQSGRMACMAAAMVWISFFVAIFPPFKGQIVGFSRVTYCNVLTFGENNLVSSTEGEISTK